MVYKSAVFFVGFLKFPGERCVYLHQLYKKIELDDHIDEFKLTKCILKCDYEGCEANFSWLPDLDMHKFDYHDCKISMAHKFQFFDP